MKYYSIDRIQAEDAYYNIIFGARSNGKSTAVCKMLIDEFKQHGHKFGRILRYANDAYDSLMQAWFDSDYLQNYVLETYGQAIAFQYGEWFFYNPGDDPNKKTIEKEIFGRYFILNSEFRYKSAQFDEITNLVFEEFVLLNPADYIPFEWEHFLSLVSTINRHRDNLRVWFIGNTLNKSNPYFQGLGIKFEKLGIYPGKLVTMHNRQGVKYAIEYAKISYEAQNEIPMILRIDGNEIAYEDGFAQDPNVYTEKELMLFLKRANAVYAASLINGSEEYGLYKVNITPKQLGWLVLKRWQMLGQKKDPIYIRLDNRLIEIDQKSGATVQYLKQIHFDIRLCLFDDEQVKYLLFNCLRDY